MSIDQLINSTSINKFKIIQSKFYIQFIKNLKEEK